MYDEKKQTAAMDRKRAKHYAAKKNRPKPTRWIALGAIHTLHDHVPGQGFTFAGLVSKD